MVSGGGGKHHHGGGGFKGPKFFKKGGFDVIFYLVIVVALWCFFMCCCSSKPSKDDEEQEEETDESFAARPQYEPLDEVPECLGGTGAKPRPNNEIPSGLQFALAKRVYWTGSFWKDYLFFLSNWHPFAGIFFCHKDHPLSRCERFFLFLVSSLQTVSGAFVYEATMELPEYPPNPIPDPSMSVYQCRAGYSRKKRDRCALYGLTSYEDCLESTDGFMARCKMDNNIFLFVYITLPIMVQMMVLRFLAVSEIFIPEKKGCKRTCAKCCFTAMQRCFFLVATLFTLGCLAFAMNIAFAGEFDESATTDMFRFQEIGWTFIESKAQAFVTWFPIYFCLPFRKGFMSKWFAEKNWLEEHPGQKRDAKERTGMAPGFNHPAELEMQAMMDTPVPMPDVPMVPIPSMGKLL